MKNKNTSVLLGCFSPPVMIATFLIEIVSAVYVLWRYKFDTKARLIVALLFCLGLFQLAEYYVCTDNSSAILASRLGYAAITLLPPLGLLLMGELTSKKLPRKQLIMLYSITVFIMSYFLLAPNAFRGYECTGNYVIFQIGLSYAYAYSVFYFGLLASSIYKGPHFLRTARAKRKIATVHALLFGYAVFIIPVSILVVLNPDTTKAIPSIMCGFAVGLAIILTALVAPKSLKKR